MDISKATNARGKVIKNTEPQSLKLNRYPEIMGPRAAMAAPIPDHRAMALVRFCPDHRAVIRASVVGKAIPAAKPPMIRAKIRISMEGAKPAMMEEGMASRVPRISIIFLPWWSPRAPNHSTDAARPRE